MGSYRDKKCYLAHNYHGDRLENGCKTRELFESASLTTSALSFWILYSGAQDARFFVLTSLRSVIELIIVVSRTDSRLKR